MEDTTVFSELISLSEKSYLKSAEFAEGLLNQGIRFPDQKAYKAFWKEVDSFLTEQAISDPVDSFLPQDAAEKKEGNLEVGWEFSA